MSQIIRKFSPGGLFTDGDRKVSISSILKTALHNVFRYLDSKGWNSRKRKAFISAYNDLLKLISEGNITLRDASGMYIDPSGRISNSKGRGFDAYGEAAYYLNSVLDALPEYTEKKPTLDKYDQSDLLTYFRNRTFGGNEPDLLIWQDRDTLNDLGVRSTVNRANYFALILDDYADSLTEDYDFTDTPYKDKDDLIQRLRGTALALRNGEILDNLDYSSLVALGIPGDTARLLFDTGTLERDRSLKKSDDPELQSALDFIDLLKNNLERLKIIDTARNTKLQLDVLQLLNNTFNTEAARNYKSQSVILPEPKYNMENWADEPGLEDYYNNDFSKIFSTYDILGGSNLTYHNPLLKEGYLDVPLLLHIVNNLDFLKLMGYSIGLDAGEGFEGFLFLPDTINTERGTVDLYNPTTREWRREAVIRIPNVLKYLYEQAMKQNLGFTWSHKDGGILKYQFGGGALKGIGLKSLDWVKERRQQAQEELKLKETEEEEKIKESADEKGMTPEEYKTNQSEPGVEGFDAYDYIRIGSIAADITSMVSAFVPVYGTAVSAATGVVSSVGNFVADQKDGFQWGDAGRFLVNLGLDVAGLIPGFGSAAKTTKMVKSLKTLVPKIMLWVTYGAGVSTVGQLFSEGTPINTAFKKLMSDDEHLTVEDWRNIAEGLLNIAGATRLGKASINSRMYKNALKDKKGALTYSLKTKSGKEVSLTKDLLNLIKGAKDKKLAGELLKSFGYDGEEVKHLIREWNMPLLGNVHPLRGFNPEVVEHFNPSGYVLRGTFNKTLTDFNNPLRFSNAWLYLKAGNLSNGITSPNWLQNLNEWRRNFAALHNPFRMTISTPVLKSKDVPVNDRGADGVFYMGQNTKMFTDDVPALTNITNLLLLKLRSLGYTDQLIRDMGYFYKKGGKMSNKNVDGANIASAYLDIISVLTSLSGLNPGTQMAGAAGIAGSVAKFESDIAKDLFDKGDVNRLLTNIGIDAQGLNPQIGVSDKISKISNTLLPTIDKILKSKSIKDNPLLTVSFLRLKDNNVTVLDLLNALQGFNLLAQESSDINTMLRRASALTKIDLISSNKKGGILKALGGGNTPKVTNGSPWYVNLGSYDINNYTANYDTSKLYSGDLKGDAWVSNIAGRGTGRYAPSEGNSREEMLRLELELYYKDFGNDLFDENNNFSEMGLEWAKQTDALLPKGSLASFFDENGNLRKSWTVTNRDAYDREAHLTFTNVKDYANYVRNDLIKGGRHNLFKKAGKRYFYTDSNGNKVYVDPSTNLSNYIVSLNGIESTVGNTTWTDYEITGLKPAQTTEGTPALGTPTEETTTKGTTGSGDPSELYGYTGGNGTKTNWWGIALDLFPSVGRLATTIWGNNKIARIAKASIKPVIEDTYNLLGRVLGNMPIRQGYYTRAAELERIPYTRNLTSDASLQTAAAFDATLKGNELRAQGDLADNQAIRESILGNWEINADNTMRRSAVANRNRARIAAANKAKADIEIGRRRANLDGILNFMKELQYNSLMRREKQRQFDLSLALSALSKGLENPLLEVLKSKIATAPEGTNIYEMPEYKEYVALSKRLANKYLLGMLRAYASIHGLRYNPYRYENYLILPIYRNGGYVEAARIRANVQAKTESAKIFLRNIEKSIDNHIKMINNLSSVTKELILKAMTL